MKIRKKPFSLIRIFIFRRSLNIKIENTIYFAFILQRKKDNPEMTKASIKIKSFYITSLEKFDKIKSVIIEYCNKLNARFYLELNPKNIKKVALLTLTKMVEQLSCIGEFLNSGSARVEQISFEQYNFHNIYDSCIATSPSINNKLWLIDVDEKNIVRSRFKTHSVLNLLLLRMEKMLCIFFIEIIDKIKNEINYTWNSINKENESNIIKILPTKNGFHMLVTPFPLNKFKKIGNVEIKKEPITLVKTKNLWFLV